MDLGYHIGAGYVTVAPAVEGDPVVGTGDPREMARVLGGHFRGLLRPMTVQKPKGTRGFSFHWSNAQAKWDVITANDPTWGLDGAEFLVYFRPDALSPLGKPWSLKEMQYVASNLPVHPGAEFAMRAARRVALAYLRQIQGV